jgi:Fe-S cluster assembly scaffold protein SufB
MRTITLHKDEYRVIPLLWDNTLQQIDYEIVLKEPGARVNIVGMYLGNGNESCCGTIKVVHDAPHTTSNIIIKSALYGHARFDINGLVEIRPGAHGSDAWLSAHVLLLSDNAKGQAVPSLEILENDVKAGHATTIGRIDEASLFYLQSRGFSRMQANRLYVNGFLQSVIDTFPQAYAIKAKKLLPA